MRLALALALALSSTGMANMSFAETKLAQSDALPASPLTQASAQGLITLPFNPDVLDYAQIEDWQGLIAQLESYQVIFHGEIHNRLTDHLIQAELVHLLHQQAQSFAIGVEWFQAPFQPWVDAYIAGEIDEGELLQRTEYFTRWRYDWRLLQPIMHYAQGQQIPVLALNAPAELTRQIAREGLDSLSPEQRAQLPDIQPPQPAHAERLDAFFSQRLGDHGQIDYLISAQRTWDETMAANAAAWLANHPKSRLLLFAGQFHLEYQHAIISDLLRRIPDLTGKTLSLANGEFEEWYENRFDGFILTQPLNLPAHGRLGSHITPQGQACLRELIADSAAESAGLQINDCIVGFNNQPIRHFSDLMLALYQTQPNQQVELLITRPAGENHRRAQLINLKLD